MEAAVIQGAHESPVPCYTYVWAFHGDADRVVSVERSREMVKAIQTAQGNVKLTIYPGVGHDSYTRTYANPELYKWFLKHERR